MSGEALPARATAHATPLPPERLPSAMVDAAIAWCVKLDHHAADPQAQLAFERWRNADPGHALAWQRLQGLDKLTSDCEGMPASLALDTLKAAAGRRLAATAGRRGAAKRLVLAGVALAAAWAARDTVRGAQTLASASTAVGEQRSWRLADGTLLVLNTDSAVGVDMVGPRRRLVLQRGEILVTTGADAGAPTKRPFWVDTPFGRLQALGTRFVVRLEADGRAGRARISVQEGAVMLYPAAAGAGGLVRAGDSRWLTAEGTRPAHALGFEADAWAEGVIAGKNMRLADLLAELARYRRGAIVCDERVAGLRLSGVFQLRQPEQTLQFLAQTQPLRLVVRADASLWVGPQEN